MLQSSVRQLIAVRYSAAHGAEPPLDYPSYCFVGGTEQPRAALGFRRACEATLFLESYLDAPVETILTGLLGRPVGRAAIVEIGDHASHNAHATVRLWAAAAQRLSTEAEIAVAVLTAPLRRMFRRLGLPIIEIAPATQQRMGVGGDSWGRYYEAEPVVCAGDIEAGRRCLTRWSPELAEVMP